MVRPNLSRIAVFSSLFLVIASCGDDVHPVDEEARPGMSFPPDYDARAVADDAGTVDAAFGEAGPAPPDFDGWVPIAGFDPTCGMYAAPSPSIASFPPPIAWGPCEARFFGGAAAGDGGPVSCKEMIDDWGSGVDVDSGLTPFGITTSAFADPTTHAVTLLVERFVGSVQLILIAEADGPVRQASVIAPTGGYICVPGLDSALTAHHAILHVEKYAPNGFDFLGAAAIGGDIDAVPTTLRIEKGDPELEPVAAATSVYLDRDTDGTHVGSWADAGDVVPPLLASLSNFASSGDDIFASLVDPQAGAGIEHTHAGGTLTTFIAADSTSTADDFGTDGTDMVWLQAHGPHDANQWDTIDIMTAPYPAGVDSPRRLRSEQTPPGDRPFVVGCGYAARQESDSLGDGIRIVRIADGRSWRLGTQPESLDAPLAIDCNEVFVNVGDLDSNLVRIRLDSLGPGEPAD